ncbi:MAG: hypothetical protein LUG86_09585 [Oscillospiraceae bacterium]|nr:hypothetical protein [Oscillospiraceae bacterium]
MKKNFTEIEAIIEERIAELEEEYELDRDDINSERLKIYKENGWSYDPFPEEDEEEEDENDGFETEWHYKSLEEQLNEVGMSMRDFL